MNLINRKKVKATALDMAPSIRCHKFTRVSDAWVDEIEAIVKREIANKIKRAPSKGCTLQPEYL
jgi:hypothetical protein